MTPYEMKLAEKREKYRLARLAGEPLHGPRLLREKSTALLKRLNQNKLNEHIAMEQWERRLLPLFLFRGSRAYQVRSMWNVAYGMYLTECDDFALGGASIAAGDVGHLCGKHAKLVEGRAVRSIFARLRACPDLTNSISKAFTEYVEWMHPAECWLTPVPLEASRLEAGRTAWWRVAAPKQARVPWWERVQTENRAYPYINRAPDTRTPEQKLLFDVHAMLPKGLPHEIRGDLCQDLIVAVLSGDASVENIPDVIGRYAREARKIMPDRWRNVSLDAALFDDSDAGLHEVLTAAEDDDECGMCGGHDHDHSEEESLLEALDR